MVTKCKFLALVLAALVIVGGSELRAAQQGNQPVSAGNNSQKTALKGKRQGNSATGKKGSSIQDQDQASTKPQTNVKKPQQTSTNVKNQKKPQQTSTNAKTQKKPQTQQVGAGKKGSSVQDQDQTIAKGKGAQRGARPGVRFVSNGNQGQGNRNVTNRNQGQGNRNVTNRNQGQGHRNVSNRNQTQPQLPSLEQ